MRDSNVEVRRRALMALGEIRDERAIPAITAALKDDDASVRRAAAMALAELAGGGGHAWRQPNPRPNPNPQPEPEPESEPQSEPQPESQPAATAEGADRASQFAGPVRVA